MIKNTNEQITVCQSEKMVAIGEVEHFFSTRQKGVSSGVFHSLNFGTHHGEADNMKRNLDLLSHSMGYDDVRFAIPRQTHSNVVAVVDHSNLNNEFDNTDALVTNIPNVFVCVKTADCVPILLYDRGQKVVGAVHSGWRGTAQNIIGRTIDVMRKEFGSQPADIIAAIGPCIGQQSYEVGFDVAHAISSLLKSPDDAVSEKPGCANKFFLNLTAANYELLKQAGVGEEHIDALNICTFTESSDFFSARRDGSKTGRMINGIAIR